MTFLAYSNSKRRFQCASLPVHVVLVFLASLSVLWWNAAPGVSFHDSGEFALAAGSAGIPHPPGSPTWVILASLFRHLVPFLEPARAANLFSGWMGALTLSLLAAAAGVWSKALFPNNCCHVAVWTAPLLLLHSRSFLEQSWTAEQYTLMTALMSLLLLVAATGPTSVGFAADSENPTSIWPKYPFFALLGFLWGLAMGNHLSQVALAPFVALAIIFSTLPGKKWRLIVRHSGATALGTLMGLLVYMWVPLRSASEPILDWGNVQSLDRLWWALTRQEWTRRPLSEAPSGFVLEWLLTYDLLGEIGLVGFMLSLGGIIVLVQKGRRYLAQLGALVIPYLLLMAFGHMQQANIDIAYIRQYGVGDWHLPLYMAGALSGAIGVAQMQQHLLKKLPWKGRRISSILGVAAVILILFPTLHSVSKYSLRGWTEPQEFIADLLSPLPARNVVLPTGDSIAFMLAYHSIYGPSNRVPVYLSAGQLVQMTRPGAERPWGPEAKEHLLISMITVPEAQPLRIPPLSNEQASSRVLISNDLGGQDGFNAYAFAKPIGFMFEVQTTQTTDQEVREAENRWRELHPNVYTRRPTAQTHRLSREAWGLLHFGRANFFLGRKMWPEASEAYQRGLEWLPQNGNGWFSLGHSLEQLGKRQQASAAYAHAIQWAPWLTGPWQNLAGLHIEVGDLEAAEKTLASALKQHAGDAELQQNLDFVRQLKNRRR